MNTNSNDNNEAIKACKRVMMAIAGHTEWHPSPEIDQDNWNEDAHIEVTLTVADCRAIKRALEKAGQATWHNTKDQAP